LGTTEPGEAQGAGQFDLDEKAHDKKKAGTEKENW